jgi:hypothetical protein
MTMWKKWSGNQHQYTYRIGGTEAISIFDAAATWDIYTREE